MPRLKYFNNDTQEWDYVIVGGQGPQGIQGEPGVISATDPIVYNSETQNVSFGSPDYITFDTTPETSSTTPGTVYWDTGEGTPTAILNADVSLNIGQENVALCYNGTGSTITNGSVVYISGAQGQRPSITLADADTEATSSKTFGMATQDILDGAEGFVTTFGVVNGVSTTSFTEGQALWLSQTPGQVTATRPLAPAHTVFVGYCLKVNGSTGRIFINPQNGYELDELHDVSISSPAVGDLVVRNAANTLWKNATLAEAGVSAVGHTHDDRYYTETETDTLLNAKANLSGATFTGKINTLGVGTESTVAAANGTGGIEIQSTLTTAASMSFHVPGAVAMNMGLQPGGNKFSIGGWSFPADSLTVDSSGRVSTQYQPSVHAYSSTKNGSGIFTNYSTSDGGIGFRYRNVGGHLNTTTGRFTAPITGRYLITGLYISSSGVVERNIAWLYINGTNIGEWTEAYGQYDDQSAASVFYLNANDYVDIATHNGIPFDGVVATIDYLG